MIDLLVYVALILSILGLIWFKTLSDKLSTRMARLEKEMAEPKDSERPFRIFLVRHGESLGNVDETAYQRMPDAKIPLTQRGAFVCLNKKKNFILRLVYFSRFIYPKTT
jgi:type I restriction-modification system DNA methylase subunit